MPACVAVINAGSSSVKFALYADGADEAASFRGQVEGLGRRPAWWSRTRADRKLPKLNGRARASRISRRRALFSRPQWISSAARRSMRLAIG